MMMMRKLFTHDDPIHVHKALGAFALMHFVYRGALRLCYGSSGLGDGRASTAVLVAMHAALSLSSLMFRIPVARHAHLQMLTAEIRAHSILFTMRSVACCLIGMVWTAWWPRILICLVTALCADVATARLGGGNRTLIRGASFGDKQVQPMMLVLYYVGIQAGGMYQTIESPDATFSYLVGVQLAAFGGTLVRKGIISTRGWHVGYAATLLLVPPVFHTESEIACAAVCAVGFMVLRVMLGLSKYTTWGLLFAAAHEARPIIRAGVEWYAQHPVLYVGARIAYVAYAAAIMAMCLWPRPPRDVRA
jgi:hypothetical protein